MAGNSTEKETAYLLKSEKMKKRLMEAKNRKEGIPFDKAAELTTVVDASGLTDLSYDHAGRVKEQCFTYGLLEIPIDPAQNPCRNGSGSPDTGVYTIRKEYDNLGRTTRVTYPDNEQVSYLYDPDGNLSGVSGYAVFSGYNALGQPEQIDFHNGASTSLTYRSDNNRLSGMTTTAPGDDLTVTPTVSAGTVQNFSYSYDLNGNITSISNGIDHGLDQTFAYDNLNRLVSAQSNSYGMINLAFDDIGNIESNSRSTTMDQSEKTLTYDYDNRPLSITKGGVTTSFIYNHAGARVSKTTGVSSTIYIGGLFERTGQTNTKHIFAGGRRIASKTGNTIYYHHPDHLGSLNIATDTNGNKAQEVSYYPFGEIRTNRHIDGIDIPYKFTGKEWDPETSFYYYGARYYDPMVGRFISADSIVQSPGDPQSLNRYAYCRNNPLMLTDPTGHFWQFLAMLAGGATLGAAMSAISGHDPAMGAVQGVISALGFMGAHIATAGLTEISEAAMVHAGFGAATGAINAAIAGQDPGFGALTGGVSGGVSRAMGGILPKGFAQQLGGRMVTGAFAGGVTAAIVGGDFTKGMFNGAWTAGFGFLFNEMEEVTVGWLADRSVDALKGIKQALKGGWDALHNEELQKGTEFGFRAALVVIGEAHDMASRDAINKGVVGYFAPMELMFKFGYTRTTVFTNVVNDLVKFGPMADRISNRIQDIDN